MSDLLLAMPARNLTCISLPLSVDGDSAFACLPEYTLQNIVDNFKFIFRYVLV